MLPSRFYDDMFDVFEPPVNKGMNCDIYEKDGMYHVEMDAPGYKKNEITIECHKGTLTIKAKKEFNKEEHEGKKYLRHERRFSSMERSFYLGDIDEDKIKAEFVDGTLKITVPTKAEETKRTISIE
jgi:HSP20 family protein